MSVSMGGIVTDWGGGCWQGDIGYAVLRLQHDSMVRLCLR
jgi:hypothetical protein